MSHMDQALSELVRWHEMQQKFWTETAVNVASVPDFEHILPKWVQTGDLLDHLLAGFQPHEDATAGTKAQTAWRDVIDAGQVYRKLIAITWQEIQRDFHAHCIAIHDPGGMMAEWQSYRDRWLAIAEAAFIRLQRKPEFLEAQRRMLLCWCRWFSAQPDAVRTAVQQARDAAKQTRQAALALLPTKIAQTPKTVIWRNGKTTVSRYESLRSAKPDLGPLLICYGLIGRQTMTDLLPQRSLVRNLLAMDVDVFVIDWGSAEPSDADKGLDHFALDQLSDCISATCDAAGTAKLTLMGICQGGVLALCHAAQQSSQLDGVICSGTPVDFHADKTDHDPAHGMLNLWVRSLGTQGVHALVEAEQGLDGEVLGCVFNQLNPIRTLARYVVDLPEAMRDPGALNTFMAMETWLADRPNLPHALAQSWLMDLYHDNALVHGNLSLRGTRVELDRIDVPVLNIVASADHIVPPPCSAALSNFIAQDRYSECKVTAGHVGVFVGRQSQTRTAPEIVTWLRSHSGNRI